ILQGAKQFIPFVIDQAVENSQGQFDKGTAKMVKGFLEGTLQAVQDSRHFLLTVSFRPEGLGLHLEAGIAADSQSNKLLKEAKPAALTGLAELPPGFLGYTAMEWGPEALKKVTPLLLGILGDPEGESGEAL